ncbi:NUDIX hydrolase, partial [Georgenia sp.]
ELLASWSAPDPRQEETVAGYLDHLRTHGVAALSRDGDPAHLTASCVVLTPDLTEVLLCFHGRGRFWVQFGGHLEPEDVSLATAARREAREESGLAGLDLLSPVPFDVDRHALSGAWRCAEHLDVGFVALAPRAAAIAVSPESGDVAWWPVDAVPAESAHGLADRVRRATEFAAAQLAAEPHP